MDWTEIITAGIAAAGAVAGSALLAGVLSVLTSVAGLPEVESE
ncbi:hypothetical protein [Ruminococcus sp. CAG:330]|nr:hypothetical protein [Ruminococcus sp. CAG:330]